MILGAGDLVDVPAIKFASMLTVFMCNNQLKFKTFGGKARPSRRALPHIAAVVCRTSSPASFGSSQSPASTRYHYITRWSASAPPVIHIYVIRVAFINSIFRSSSRLGCVTRFVLCLLTFSAAHVALSAMVVVVVVRVRFSLLRSSLLDPVLPGSLPTSNRHRTCRVRAA